MTTISSPIPRTHPTPPSTSDAPPGLRRGARRALPSGWPLSVLFLGFPLWWALGMGTIILPVLAVPMGLALLQRGRLLVPRGFGLWLLLLAWVAAGVLVLWVDAPGAVAGGGAGRLLTFGFRAAMYLTVTIIFLYVGNATEAELSKQRVTRLLAYMFMVCVAGGLLGAAAPGFEFTSPLEALLPQSLAQNPFVLDMIHPSAAQVQSFLGYAEGRPSAPFTYTNDWGANLSLLLPFFCLAWLSRGAGWRRVAAPFVLAIAIVPIVLSLNRGLWIGLALAAALVAVRLGLRGRVWALGGLGIAVVVAAVSITATPLGSLVTERINAPHSNLRRVLLAEGTIRSALGSPIVGFGTTRDVQGNFVTIAGGARSDCRTCAAPPFGTHGHLFLLMFCQGFIGLALFVVFLARRFARHWRENGGYAMAACVVVALFGLYLLIYNLLGLAMVIVFIGLALAWRAERDARAPG